jgi:FtsP/CotA-like multicopper oxidase with cupredoxin domain
MDLNTEGMVFTLNGKSFPITDNINVKKGDKVLVKLVNNSLMNDHPMANVPARPFFPGIKKKKPVEASPIIKDTFNLKPGDEYVVAFAADNPGNWLFHCHDLHHASSGMINLLNMKDSIHPLHRMTAQERSQNKTHHTKKRFRFKPFFILKRQFIRRIRSF